MDFQKVTEGMSVSEQVNVSTHNTKVSNFFNSVLASNKIEGAANSAASDELKALAQKLSAAGR